ncbi:hypothetical protein B0H66DRAFT_44259 [Apodospora peruviana]|uniref:Uncharacterized protein n=1 Tax=Apodospora peruviana TaxID=516989 RepID=A0AAE0IRZ6_9PEZI|nr:hypothetical protein B0H66DRAFT_44259 [Apodospora peruviana]
MSGVKNLRAMFEQKGDSSPPDRGRSPGIPLIIPAAGSESPRPLSKVRTNFIAIEKDGRIGLQRETSQDSSVSASRKPSGGSDVRTPSPLQEKEKPNAFEASMVKAAAKMNLKDQPIPESPHTDVNGGPVKAVSPKTVPVEVPAGPVAQPKKLGLEGGAGDDAHVAGNGSKSNGETGCVNGTDYGKDKGKAPAKEAERADAKITARAPPKTLAVSSSSKTAAKLSRSPTVVKAPRSPAEMAAPKLPAKTPDGVAQQPEKAVTPRGHASSSRPPAASPGKRPPPLQPSPSSGVGFVKPKPKSPTRPIKLPPSLTTHTAASGSKVNVPRQSVSRASGAVHTAESFGRPPSRTSVPTATTSGARSGGTKNLKRQNSTINRPRPSLGPPPKQPARDHPPTKKEKEVDEGFLARMMRPTQASSSKTAEKAPTTPPRKASVAPAARRPANKPDSKETRKAVSKPAGGPSRSSSRAPQSSTASQIAVQAEQATTAEEVIEAANANEGEISLQSDAGQKSTTAKDIAPVVEQSETAEEAIKVAEEAEGKVDLPKPVQIGEQINETEQSIPEPTEVIEQAEIARPETPTMNGNYVEDNSGVHKPNGLESDGAESFDSPDNKEMGEKKEESGGTEITAD